MSPQLLYLPDGKASTYIKLWTETKSMLSMTTKQQFDNTHIRGSLPLDLSCGQRSTQSHKVRLQDPTGTTLEVFCLKTPQFLLHH